MKACIAVPCFNRLEYVKTCIPGAFMTGNRVVAVDDGSTDGTREWLLSVEGRAGGPTKVIVHPNNVGIATSVNEAWAVYPDAEYLVKLDSDIDAIRTDWLEAMVEVYEAFHDAGVVGIPVLGVSHADNNELVSSNDVEAVKTTRFVNGACMMVRRDRYEKCGPLRQFSRPYGQEDVDYSVRLMAAGYSNYYVPGRIGEWVVHLPDVGPDYRRWKGECRADVLAEQRKAAREYRETGGVWWPQR